MPSSSPKQARLMAAAAHDQEFAKRNKIPQWVAKEFNRSDAGTAILRRAEGGAIEGAGDMASRTAKKSRPAAPGIMVKPSPKGEAPTTFPGKAVMEESKQRSKGFKTGGGVGSESVAEGTAQPGQRLDKKVRRASGGAVPSMRGRSPLSAAASTSEPSGKFNH